MHNGSRTYAAFIHTAHHHFHVALPGIFYHAKGRSDAGALGQFDVDAVKVTIAFGNILFVHAAFIGDEGQRAFRVQFFHAFPIIFGQWLLIPLPTGIVDW